MLLDPGAAYDLFLSASVRGGATATRRWERWGTIETDPLRATLRAPIITNVTAVTAPPVFGVRVTGHVDPRDIRSRVGHVELRAGAAFPVTVAAVDAGGAFSALVPSHAAAGATPLVGWAVEAATLEPGDAVLADKPPLPPAPPGQPTGVVAVAGTSTVDVQWTAPAFTGGLSELWTHVNWTTTTDTGAAVAGSERTSATVDTITLADVPVGPDRLVFITVGTQGSLDPPRTLNATLAPPGAPFAPISAVQVGESPAGVATVLVSLHPESGGSPFSRVCVGPATCTHIDGTELVLNVSVWMDPGRPDPAPVTVFNAAGFGSPAGPTVALDYALQGAAFRTPSFGLVGWTPTAVVLAVNDTDGAPGSRLAPWALVDADGGGRPSLILLPSLDVGTTITVPGVDASRASVHIGGRSVDLGAPRPVGTSGAAPAPTTVDGVGYDGSGRMWVNYTLGDTGELSPGTGGFDRITPTYVFVPGVTQADQGAFIAAMQYRYLTRLTWGAGSCAFPVDRLPANVDATFTVEAGSASATSAPAVRTRGPRQPDRPERTVTVHRRWIAVRTTALPLFGQGGVSLSSYAVRGVNVLGLGLTTDVAVLAPPAMTVTDNDGVYAGENNTVFIDHAVEIEPGVRTIDVFVVAINAAGLESGHRVEPGGMQTLAACPAGTYDPSFHNASAAAEPCAPCPAGAWSFGGGNVGECPACPPGRTGQGCAACPPGSASFGSALACSPCPAGTFQDAAGADGCQSCPGAESGTQYSLSNSTACAPCPENTECPGAVLRVVAGTWWAGGVPASRVYTCPNPDQCRVSQTLGFVVVPNATVVLAPVCAPGDQFTGLLCAECGPDHVPVNDACVACPPPWVSVAACVLVAAFGVGVTSFMLSRAFAPRSKSNKNSTKAAILMRQIVNYLQIMGALSTASIKGPRTFAVVASLSDVAVALTPDLVPLRCLANTSVYTMFWVFVALPAVQTLAAGVWLVRKHMRTRSPTAPQGTAAEGQEVAVEMAVASDKMKAASARARATAGVFSRPGSVRSLNPERDGKLPAASPDVRAENAARAGNPDNKELSVPVSTLWGVTQNVLAALLVIVSLMYVQLARACLRMYDCYDEEVEGVLPMRSDFSVNCDTGEHRRMRLLALCFGAFYLVAVPGAVALLLYRRRRELYANGAFQRVWYFVYAPYRRPSQSRESKIDGGFRVVKVDARYAWDFVVAMQKLALVAVSTTMSNPVLQAFAMVLVLSFMITMQAAYRPYASARGNRLALGAYCVALVTQSVVLAQWIQSDDLNPSGTGSALVTGFLLVLNAGYIAVFFAVAFRMLYVTTKKRSIQRRAQGVHTSTRRHARRGARRGGLPTVVREREGKDDGGVVEWGTNPMALSPATTARRGHFGSGMGSQMNSARYTDSYSYSQDSPSDDADTLGSGSQAGDGDTGSQLDDSGDGSEDGAGAGDSRPPAFFGPPASERTPGPPRPRDAAGVRRRRKETWESEGGTVVGKHFVSSGSSGAPPLHSPPSKPRAGLAPPSSAPTPTGRRLGPRAPSPLVPRRALVAKEDGVRLPSTPNTAVRTVMGGVARPSSPPLRPGKSPGRPPKDRRAPTTPAPEDAGAPLLPVGATVETAPVVPLPDQPPSDRMQFYRPQHVAWSLKGLRGTGRADNPTGEPGGVKFPSSKP